MTIYAAAWELETIIPTVGVLLEDTTPYRMDTNYNNLGLEPVDSSREGYLAFGTTLSDFWWHVCIIQVGGSTNTGDAIWSYNNGASLEFRVIHSPSSQNLLQFQKTTNNGSSWTTILTFPSPNQLTTYDFRLKIDATTGFIRVYHAGTLVASFTGDTSSTTNLVDRIQLKNFACTFNYMELIVADEPTINWRLQTLTPTASGFYSEWTGSYTAIDDTTLNDADFITINTTNARFLCDVTDYYAAGMTSMETKAIIIASRQLITVDSTPTAIKHMLRSNSTDYATASLGVTVDGSFYNKQTIFATNPTTGVKWTNAEVNALQIGVKTA